MWCHAMVRGEAMSGIESPCISIVFHKLSFRALSSDPWSVVCSLPFIESRFEGTYICPRLLFNQNRTMEVQSSTEDI